MADTKPALSRAANPAPVEGDGISYRGLFGFGAILVVTTVVCQLLMLGMLKYMDAAAAREDAERAPLSAPVGQTPPPPNLLTNEPLNLQTFREREDAILNSYGWMDKNAGIIRIPIDRAKELVLERGIPGGSPITGPSGPAGPSGPTGPSGPPTTKVIK